MPRLANVNGFYRPINKAVVGIEDRGFQFADAIYEVVVVINDIFIDEEAHLARMTRSLSEVRIKNPFPSQKILQMRLRDLLRVNRLRSALVYIQISRGEAPRFHPFPREHVKPTSVLIAKSLNLNALLKKAEKGITLKSEPDLRWARCDIKTVGLLPNVLAIQAAIDAGYDDTILVDREGNITECGSSNLFIVTQDDKLVTPPLGAEILPGVTRATVLSAATEIGLTVEERKISLEEATRAREAFVTSAAKFVTPVNKIDSVNFAENTVSGMLSARYRAFFGLKP